jgi:hypothetical protein
MRRRRRLEGRRRAGSKSWPRDSGRLRGRIRSRFGLVGEDGPPAQASPGVDQDASFFRVADLVTEEQSSRARFGRLAEAPSREALEPTAPVGFRVQGLVLRQNRKSELLTDVF